MPWRPLLEGGDAKRALEIVRLIGERTREAPPDVTGTLYGGLGGRALLHGYLSVVEPGAGHDVAAMGHLEHATDQLGDPIQVGLAWGVAGISWVTHHLATLGLPVEVDDSLDEFLETIVAETPWDHPHDLMEGLAGIALSVIGRVRDPRPQRILGHVLARFEEIAKPSKPGLTMTYVQPSARGTGEEPTLVGPSHGVAGVIAVLARYVELDLDSARARGLLDAMVESLLAHRLPPDAAATFPTILEAKLRPLRKGGSGWCHGDPGIASALFAAGERTNRDDWKTIATGALRVARSDRLLDAESVGLCHGLVGLAHVFHRADLASPDDMVRDLAIALYRRALDRWEQPDDNDDLELLEGKVGTALGLLAGATAIEPRWDEAFLMS
jgi:lantibiotic modifying enzyme